MPQDVIRQRPTAHVCVAYLSAGAVDHQFCSSLVSTLLDPEAGPLVATGGHISLESGPRIVEARTQIVDHFVKQPALAHCDWLWLIDADMSWDVDALPRLLATAEATGADVVGGLCFAGGHSDRIYPTIYRAITTAEGFAGVEPVEDFPTDGPITVAGTGAAFVIIRRSILLKMLAAFGRHPDSGKLNPYPWFVEGVNPAGEVFGEDIAFCQRVRALGGTIVVDPTVEVGHHKRRALTKAVWNEWRRGLVTGNDPTDAVTVG